MPTTKTVKVEINLPSIVDGSDMAVIHRSAYLRPALLTIPEWQHAATALSHLYAVRPPRKRWGSLEEEMTAYVENLTEQRQPFDAVAAEDFAVKAHARVAALQATEAGFTQAARGYGLRLDEAVRGNTGLLYGYLTEQTRIVVDEARAIADAFDLDAESAIAAKAVDAFQAARELQARFTAVRSTLTAVRGRLGWNTMNAGYPELEFISNPTEVFENWRAWKVDGYLVNDLGERQTLRAPWPEGRTAAADWLRYLAHTPQAQPWVPTPEQYDEAASELSEYARGIRDEPMPQRWVTEPPRVGEFREDNRPTSRVRPGLA